MYCARCLFMYGVFKRKKVIFYLLSFLAAICSVAVAVSLLSKGTGKEAPKDSNSVCVSFLKEKKVPVSEEKPVSIETTSIKKEQSEVFRGYNELQKKQGFDLSVYSGKTVTKYTYRVTDRKRNDLVAVVFLYDGKIIGGDIHCIGADGYMTGFDGETV